MAIDLKAIDKQIKKLRLLKEFGKELNADPEFQALVREFAIKNGQATKPTPAKEMHATGQNGNGSSRRRGFFVAAVHGAILNLGTEFTSEDIEKGLRASGVEIRAANANIAINEALRTLEERVIVARSGKRNGVQIIWKKAISAVESRTA